MTKSSPRSALGLALFALVLAHAPLAHADDVPDPITNLLATANVEAGHQAAHACAMCHNFDKDGPNKMGPNLWGIVNRPPAHVDSFTYSAALHDIETKKWDYDELNDFLFHPKVHAPGTKMLFAGIKDTQQRANVIAWLRTLTDNPPPLPATK